MSKRWLSWGLLVTGVVAQVPEPGAAVPTTGVTTLYRYDDLRSAWGFSTGDYGLVEQDGDLRNRDSQVALGADAQGNDVLRFGVQGGETVRAVDFGDPRDKATQRSLFHRLTRQSVLQRLEAPAGAVGSSGAAIELGHIHLLRIDRTDGEPLVVALRIVDYAPGRYVSFRWRVFGRDAAARRNVKEDLDKAKMDVGRISDAVEMFYIRNSRLPTLRELVTPDVNGQAWLRGVEGVPRDAWGHEYRLVPGEQRGNFEIRSDGPDGLPDTEDDVSSKSAHTRRR